MQFTKDEVELSDKFSIDKDGYRLVIQYDDSPESPREWSPLGNMAMFHNRFNFPNDDSLDSDNFNGWDEMKEYIVKQLDAAVILPVYMYEHSNIALSTDSFNDRWDSGQVGFIYVSKAKLREEYHVKHMSKKLLDKVTTYLKNEVETYSKYVDGQVYGYNLSKLSTCEACGDEHEEDVGSCWGFYDLDSLLECVNSDLS